MQADRVMEACLYASDLDAAAAFYPRVLGLEIYSRVEGRHVFFRCGQSVFLVFNPEKTRLADSRPPAHGATGAGHVAFATRESYLEVWRAQLRAQSVPIEREIDWPAGGHSIYFRDPAGNSIELVTPQVWGLPE